MRLQTRRRVFYHNHAIRLSAAALNVPRRPATHTTHFIFSRSAEIVLHSANRILALQPSTLSDPEPDFHLCGAAHPLSGMCCYKSASPGSWLQMNLQSNSKLRVKKRTKKKPCKVFAERCSQMAGLFFVFLFYSIDETQIKAKLNPDVQPTRQENTSGLRESGILKKATQTS